MIKNFYLISALYGIILASLNIIANLVEQIDKIYKIVSNISIGILFLISIVILGMLNADWNISKNQMLIGGTIEVGSFFIVVLVVQIIEKLLNINIPKP